ncbi:response regulator transcription factor [Shewanella sp. SR43-4]|jgi:DNA-binding response OmpR family regulator|uniref:Response regulator transcription factor n=1 Tax=Shewanella vesiculosa TaxID=518738 RepID=A0ABV0FQH5_9GAMM|nr:MULTISPECIES: response regulator transcription factor [Shewanella]MBB1316424.1 response regulator transcription factor [Shewanella sp. SR43-4]NCO70878.1 response regulator transcription factor [Shewanella vesiculosa]NCP36995.1 response regulator transcription factor [Shewanella vesiculosa]NCP68912.1 response regulator transcription factor [Shewanella vesiculosa]NCP74332.1 response regulator transcription factor [Shewanella vesiculosa]|tara:strand:- start:11461 stop:12144 length:684 start_codon:yes stop_codon:yes gene_type:complete
MFTDKLQLLLVEDDLDLATAVIEYLELEGILCDHSANGSAGLNLILLNRYDAVILDLNLPKMNGLQVCESLRLQGIDVPVLMLTARDTLNDKLDGFAKGADDYLIKPFAMEELIVRIRVLSRRRSGQAMRLTVADLVLDLQQKQAFRNGVGLKLSPTAFKILDVLIRASPNPVSREKLMQSVWGDDQPDSNSLKVHMFNLRKHLDGNQELKLLHTVSGHGFAIKDNQ